MFVELHCYLLLPGNCVSQIPDQNAEPIFEKPHSYCVCICGREGGNGKEGEIEGEEERTV